MFKIGDRVVFIVGQKDSNKEFLPGESGIITGEYHGFLAVDGGKAVISPKAIMKIDSLYAVFDNRQFRGVYDSIDAALKGVADDSRYSYEILAASLNVRRDGSAYTGNFYIFPVNVNESVTIS